MARVKIIKAENGKNTDKRYGCPFTTQDLDRACKATDLGRTEMEKMLKTAFGKAKIGKDPVTVHGVVTLTKGKRGLTAHIATNAPL